MSHIQLAGDPQAVAAAKALLAGWGMTCRELDHWPTPGPLPTVSECDALLVALSDESAWARQHAASTHQFSEGHSGGACPAPAAPLLLLGRLPGRFLLSREAWQVVEEPGPAGSDLRFALQACVDRARRLRGAVDHHQIQEDYFHFLGHELRSPLTAVKTALEVLQGDLGGLLTDEAPGVEGRRRHPSLKMLDIGLRNVRRLQDTVDWSQDLLELSRGHFSADNRSVPVTDLASLLDLDMAQVDLPAGTHVLTDPTLLPVLSQQVGRLLDYLSPGARVQAHVRLTADPEARVVVSLSAADEPGAPRVSRTRLASGADDRLVQWQELAEFVVARPLLDQLQVRLDVHRQADGGPCVEMILPEAAPAAADSPVEESSGLLHTHV